jgi:hypothetical protein
MVVPSVGTAVVSEIFHPKNVQVKNDFAGQNGCAALYVCRGQNVRKKVRSVKCTDSCGVIHIELRNKVCVGTPRS